MGTTVQEEERENCNIQGSVEMVNDVTALFVKYQEIRVDLARDCNFFNSVLSRSSAF